MTLTTAYAKFRGSNWFLLTLCAYCTGMILGHIFLGVDPEWGFFNLTLSIEASVSVALLIMDGEKKEVHDDRVQEHMVMVLDAIAKHDGLLRTVIEAKAFDQSN